jgi:peptidoglycan-N-acetylmuramic acid deacetylase
MRKFVSWIVITCMVATVFTGCEPNVPEDDKKNDSVNDMLDKNNNNNNSNNNNNNNNNNGSENNGGMTNKSEEATGGGDTNNGDNSGGTAVEGETSAADFSEAISDYNLPLSAGFSNRVKPAVAENSNDFTHLPGEKIKWGLGKLKDGSNRPVDAVNANEKFKSLGAVFVGDNESVIYLTFDEGYENGLSGKILDTLKEKNAKATFFVTYDYCKRSQDLVRRMIDEGHTVGNHSCSHPSFPECSVAEIREEIGTLHDYVKETFNYEMNQIRFPRGEFSEQSLAVAQDMGYTSVFWSFAYQDWNVDDQPEPSAAIEKIKEATHPGGIILLHAVSKTNSAILGELLDYWQNGGYRLGLFHQTEE